MRELAYNSRPHPTLAFASEMTPLIKSVELPNQVRLPYVEQGDPSGVPVVLLHGLTDSWRSFELVLPHLPQSIRAFALTQRGHGDASRPEAGYRFHDFAADAAAFMDALDLEAAVIAGHSSHSFVAQRFAIDRPESTLGLVLIGPPASMRDKPGLRELYDSTISKLTDPIDPSFVRKFAEGTTGPVPHAFLEAQVQETLKMPARVWREAFGALFEDDLAGERDMIKAPTLIVWGDQDEIVPRSEPEVLLTAIAGSQLVVYEGVGHSPHWEQPDRFASDLAAFVERLGSVRSLYDRRETRGRTRPRPPLGRDTAEEPPDR